ALRTVVEVAGVGGNGVGAAMRQLAAVGYGHGGILEGGQQGVERGGVVKNSVLGQEDVDVGRGAVHGGVAGAAVVEVAAGDACDCKAMFTRRGAGSVGGRGIDDLDVDGVAAGEPGPGQCLGGLAP